MSEKNPGKSKEILWTLKKPERSRVAWGRGVEGIQGTEILLGGLKTFVGQNSFGRGLKGPSETDKINI